MRHTVIAHGDCDGVISAAIYIKHYLKDLYPSYVTVGFTQPWRASNEIRRLCDDQCTSLTILDIAIDKEIFSSLIDLVMRGVDVYIIDHHATTKPWIEKLRELGVKILWNKATSTPRLMAENLSLTLNMYEKMLIKVADSCEGSEADEEIITNIADSIKLAISRDPSDLRFLKEFLDLMVKAKSVEDLEKLKRKAYIGKLLLKKLIEKIISNGEIKGNTLIVSMKAAESRLFAGLFGIAATEVNKMLKKDIVIVRDEETKIVVTVRSLVGSALKHCENIVKVLGGKYGGHNEAASATITGYSIDKVVKVVREIIEKGSE